MQLNCARHLSKFYGEWPVLLARTLHVLTCSMYMWQCKHVPVLERSNTQLLTEFMVNPLTIFQAGCFACVADSRLGWGTSGGGGKSEGGEKAGGVIVWQSRLM